MEEKWAVAKLNTSNYSTWKLNVKRLLIAKDLFDHVDGTAADKAVYKSSLAKALSNNILSVGDEVLYLVSDCTTAKEA
jgi:hypothetical protein